MTTTPTTTVPSACGQVEHQPCAVGCLGDCDQLGRTWGDVDARARWHERAVALLSSPAMAEVAWFFEQLCLAQEGDEETWGLHPVDVRTFVAEHNWPDPMMVTRFAWAFDFLAIQRVQRAAQLGRWV
jgi:hypothetical protein